MYVPRVINILFFSWFIGGGDDLIYECPNDNVRIVALPIHI